MSKRQNCLTFSYRINFIVDFALFHSNKQLVAFIWILHCVVYGQLPLNNFDPYHHPYYIPYTSTFINQPATQINDKTEARGTGELGNQQNLRNFFGNSFNSAISLKIKQLEETTASLARQLKGMKK